MLIRFLPNIDPKKKVKYNQPVLVKLSYALVLFLSAMNVVIIYSTKMGHFVMDVRILFPAISLLMAYLGNLFNSLKPNYFVGVRTPWTLENEAVWKKTHQLTGRSLGLEVAFYLPSSHLPLKVSRLKSFSPPALKIGAHSDHLFLYLFSKGLQMKYLFFILLLIPVAIGAQTLDGTWTGKLQGVLPSYFISRRTEARWTVLNRAPSAWSLPTATFRVTAFNAPQQSQASYSR